MIHVTYAAGAPIAQSHPAARERTPERFGAMLEAAARVLGRELPRVHREDYTAVAPVDGAGGELLELTVRIRAGVL